MEGQAEIVIINGKLITFDEKNTVAEAIAVKRNKILAVGKTDQILNLANQETRIIDALGRTVLPGFIESHMHLFSGSVDMENLNLFGITDASKLKEVVFAFTDDHNSDDLLFAVQADYKIFHQTGATSRHDLDKIIANRPFAMISSDYHTVWANTKALQLAGILEGGRVAKGSEIVMAEDGMAQGELREFDAYKPIVSMKKTQGRESIGFLSNGEPSSGITPEQKEIDKSVLKRGLAHCARAGITSIHNMDGNFYQLELLEELNQSNDLLCRVQVPFYIDNEAQVGDLQRAVEMRDKYNSEMVYSGRVKFFMDGVIESGTAFLCESYSNDPENFGSAIFSDQQFNQLAIEADKLGLQMSVHAIGDAAVKRTLDGYQAAREVNGVRDSRHRIEHIEIIDPIDIQRLANLGVVASMQPLHAAGGGKFPSELIIESLGTERMKNSYPTQTLRQAGVTMIFSSDWPVVQVEPIDSIKSAVTRKRVLDNLPDQRQSLLDTLASYTRDGAYTEFSEDKKGMLRAGMLADIVIMSEDLEMLDSAHLDEAVPVMTICDGRVTYEANR